MDKFLASHSVPSGCVEFSPGSDRRTDCWATHKVSGWGGQDSRHSLAGKEVVWPSVGMLIVTGWMRSIPLEDFRRHYRPHLPSHTMITVKRSSARNETGTNVLTEKYFKFQLAAYSPRPDSCHHILAVGLQILKDDRLFWFFIHGTSEKRNWGQGEQRAGSWPLCFNYSSVKFPRIFSHAHLHLASGIVFQVSRFPWNRKRKRERMKLVYQIKHAYGNRREGRHQA